MMFQEKPPDRLADVDMLFITHIIVEYTDSGRSLQERLHLLLSEAHYKVS